MAIKFANNAEGILTAGVGSGDTTNMQLTSGNGLLFPTVDIDATPATYFYATLVKVNGTREIVQVTEHQAGTDVFQRFVRARDDTLALAFEIGDKVQMRPSAIMFNTFRDGIAANLASIAANLASITALELYNTNSQVLAGPTGLVMYIYNPVAEVPTGWSLHAGPADCLLAVAGGASSYNTPGETMAGTWTRTGHVHGQAAHTHTGPSHTHTGPSHTHTGPSHTHTGPSHTHTTPGHTLTEAEMPAHYHNNGLIMYPYSPNFAAYGSTASPNVTGKMAGNFSSTAFSGGVQYYTDTKGSGSSHAHGDTGAEGTGATAASGTAATGASGTAATGASGTAATSSDGGEDTTNSKDPITDRPYAAVGFLIERD